MIANIEASGTSGKSADPNVILVKEQPNELANDVNELEEE